MYLWLALKSWWLRRLLQKSPLMVAGTPKRRCVTIWNGQRILMAFIRPWLIFKMFIYHSVLYIYILRACQRYNTFTRLYTHMDRPSPAYSGTESVAPRRTARPRMWTILTSGASKLLSIDFQKTSQSCFYLLTHSHIATSTSEFAGRTCTMALRSTVWSLERRGPGKRRSLMRREELHPPSLRPIACHICLGLNGSQFTNKYKILRVYCVAFFSSNWSILMYSHSRPILSGIPGTKHSDKCFR